MGSPSRERKYRFLRAAVTNCHQLGVLTQQKCAPSQSWRPDVQNQSVSRVTLPLKALGRILTLLPASGGSWHSLACGHITAESASVFTGSSFPCIPLFLLFCLLYGHTAGFRAHPISITSHLTPYIKCIYKDPKEPICQYRRHKRRGFSP